MAGSPTSRTLGHARKLGFEAGVVERRNPRSFITHDLFGFVDVVAAGPGGVLFVQACAAGDAARRKAKILSIPAWKSVVRSAAMVEVWGWAKRGARGKRKLWSVRRERLSLDGEWFEILEPEEIPF